jgi:hypothetical protein
VPDDLPRRAPVLKGEPPPTDFAELVCVFAEAYPGWLRRDGKPISWRLFVYGLDVRSRQRARDALMLASAVGLPYTKQQDATDWLQTQRIMAGW